AMVLDPLRTVATRTDVPLVLTTVENSRLGRWTGTNADALVSFGRGLRGSVRGLAAVTEHLAGAPPRTGPPPPPVPAPLPRATPVASEVGPIVGFDEAMAMLSEHGIAVAPWLVVDDPTALDGDVLAKLGDDLVVKLADVPHR